MIIDDLFEATQSCPHCGGPMFSEMLMMEKKDACYYKVKASAKVWPSAYASGRLVQCRKKGAGNYGNKSEGVMEMDKSQTPPGRDGSNDEGGKKEYTAKAITPKKVAKDGEKILNKELNKKQGVAEGSLEEIDRRGFLKGMGAAAVAGAAGGAKADWDVIRKLDLLTGENATTGFQNNSNENPNVSLVVNKWPDVGGSGFVVIISPVPLPLPPAGTLGRLVGKQGLVVVSSPYRMMIGKKLFNNLTGGIFPETKGTGMILAVADSFNSELVSTIANAVKNKEEIKIEISNANKVYTFTGENVWSQKESVQQGVAEGELDEGWKSALGAAAIAGTMAMGGGAHARVSGDYVDNPEINRLTGQPKVTQQISPDAAKPAAAKPGFSKEYLQSVVDGTHPRPLISKERAQELLQQQTTNEQSKQQKGADYRDPPEADYGDDYQDMVARVKKLAGLGPLKTVYDPTKRVYRNVPTAVQPKK